MVFSFMDYMATLPAAKMDQLYDSAWTCQAVLRSLPPLAKQYVLRLLYVDSAQTADTMSAWVNLEGTAKHKVALTTLKRLNLLVAGSTSGSLRLHPAFQAQLRHSITASEPPCVATLPADAAKGAHPPTEMEVLTEAHWEELLLFLVGSTEQPPGTLGSAAALGCSPLQVTELLMQAGLAGLDSDSGELAITDEGFQFLLTDAPSQLWVLLRKYVEMSELQGGVEVAAVIGFLLQMGFQSLHQPYECASLSAPQQQVVSDLSALGVLFLYQHKDQCWYYPTKLAAHLAGGLAGNAGMATAEGYIMVETNFRVYAYTTSKLALAILHMFTRPDYRLPNLYVGTLSMASVRSALSSGISANQIVSYLQHNAHPHVANRIPVVPETVSDQIRLWEADRNRVQQYDVVLYEEFPSAESFVAVEGKARDQGVLLWADAAQRRMAVMHSAHQGLREYIKANTRIK